MTMTNETIQEGLCSSQRHTSFYLSSGTPGNIPVIFCHGWPELSLSWRHQLPSLAALGFQAIAPDMRGYGRSSQHPAIEDYAVPEIEADMIELLDHIGAEKAIWVGHDWGTPIVWSIAQHHPDRCHGVAGICVPYLPNGFTLPELVRGVDRKIYPEDQFPLGQWDYWQFHRDAPNKCRRGFERNLDNTFRALFRSGQSDSKSSPSITAMIRTMGGWFGPDGAAAPDMPIDTGVIHPSDLAAYVAAYERTGFSGPNNWYRNDQRNTEHARLAKTRNLEMPALFVHAANDGICETINSSLASPMRAHCQNLTEVTIESGHWVAQEKPDALNVALADWISSQFPEFARIVGSG